MEMGGAPQPALPPPSAGGCGGMMGCMGGGGAKAFYPALMDMPSLTPEARRFIETEAGKRLGLGSEAITTGQAPIHQALSTNDPVAMLRAVAGVREGVLQFESGAAALRAMDEAQPPRQIALAWFKGQMSVADGDAMAMSPWGLSWYHLATMAFLVAFMLGAFLIHYARLGRIGELVRRLAPAGPATAKPAVAADPVADAKPTAAPNPAAAGKSATATKPSAPAKPAAAEGPGASAAQPATSADPAAAKLAASAPDSALKRPWSGKLRVNAIFDETPTVKTFRLTGLERGPIPFTFLPGQFLTFSAELDGKPIRRSYTIASSPTQRDYVEITVKREDQGVESRYLHDHVAVGDPIAVSGPTGAFTFTEADADSIVLISGGVGITPMMCVVRYLTDRSFPGDIFFIYGARTAQDFIFREELEYLEKRHPRLHLAVTMEKVENKPWTGAVGRISKEFVAHAVPDIARRRVHVCGPPPMMEAVKAQLLELGVAKEKIKTEAFGPAKGAVPPAAAPASAPTPQPAADAAVSSAQASIRFSKSNKDVPLAPDKSVLETAESVGVPIDFQCRVGTCGICKIQLLEGEVTMEVQEALTPEDKANKIILACQAKSIGNLVVEA